MIRKKVPQNQTLSSTILTTSTRRASSPGLRRNASRELGPIWVKSLILGFAANLFNSMRPSRHKFRVHEACFLGIQICKTCFLWWDPPMQAPSVQWQNCNLRNIPDSEALDGKTWIRGRNVVPKDFVQRMFFFCFLVQGYVGHLWSTISKTIDCGRENNQNHNFLQLKLWGTTPPTIGITGRRKDFFQNRNVEKY